MSAVKVNNSAEWSVVVADLFEAVSWPVTFSVACHDVFVQFLLGNKQEVAFCPMKVALPWKIVFSHANPVYVVLRVTMN